MKKGILIVWLMAFLILASSCTFIPAATLESMFRGSQQKTEPVSVSGDTVTISRAEYERLQKFSDLAELIDDADSLFYQDFDKTQLYQYAAKGLMAGLGDPYSFYYTPEEFEEMWKDDEGNYTGIGVLITSNFTTQICTISRVFRGSPAEKAGVHRGDILYRVGEDLYVTADNINEAVDIMRGLPGTDVEVTFLRDGEELTFRMTRAEVVVNQIESTMLDDQVGYIAFYQFAGSCEKEFEAALKDLIAKGARSVVIDLRDNPGGWVDQARYVADLFMDQGEACYLQFRNGFEDHTEYQTHDGKEDMPIVVLINENSASSSEILTGALKDCAGATVVGVKSFGKGIIQQVMPVGTEGAGMQITIAQYFTPAGHAVHQVGIVPDVEISLPEGDNGMYSFADLEGDPQLKKAYEVMCEKMKSEGITAE